MKTIPVWVKRKIPKKIKEWLYSKQKSKKRPSPVYNVSNLGTYTNSRSEYRKKYALLSYITRPFILSNNSISCNSQFSNFGIARSIVRVLNELGYIVDIVEWDDIKFQPTKKYDLFIGHGGCNFKHIARRLSKDTMKIYFSTGLYWQEGNRREKERFDNLRKRRNVRLPYDRWIKYSEEYANKSADGIICLGNHVAKESYSKFPLVINLNNAAYSNDQYSLETKDFSVARQNFYFFAGGGNVHKGLALLLEAFSQVENANLYICQEIDKEFYKLYRHELEDCPNIHLVGWVPMRGQEFYDLVNKCAFLIYPSCSEGQPGTVIECMHFGLIPILSKESNVDTGDYGITLNSCQIEEIINVIQDLSQRSPEWCKDMSLLVQTVAASEFSEEAFLKNMKKGIEYIIKKKNNKKQGG